MYGKGHCPNLKLICRRHRLNGSNGNSPTVERADYESHALKVDKNNIIVMTGKITLSEKKTLSENYRP